MIDDSIKDFNQKLESVCDPLFTRSTNNTNYENNTGFNDDQACNDKRKSYYRALNRFRHDHSDDNRNNMIAARSEYKKEVRRFNFFEDQKKTSKLMNAKVKNAKEYWRLLKSTVSGTTKHSNKLSVDTFAQYFKAINNPVDPFYQPDEDIIYFNERFINSETQVMFQELDFEISCDEIKLAISQLKQGKSGGPDILLNEFYIYGIDYLIQYLHTLFNQILCSGYFPEKWSDGFIVPLHKKGSVDEANNYRGITLLSTLGKLFTRILNNRLTKWAEYYNVYIEAQAGFRAGMSTTDNIFVIHGLVNHMLNNSKKLYCAFVDFTKAFDYVVRDVIWYKLIKIGVRGKLLNVLKSMYANVKSRVKLMNETSDDFECSLGVRQGECLSPFLFAMYLNDLEEEFHLMGADGIDVHMVKLFILLYADDIVIFANSAEGLQRNLNILHNYCQRWKLTVNVAKTKIIVFRKGGQLPRNLRFIYNGLNIEIVEKFSYLGIVLTSGGSFSNCQTTLAGQAQKAVFALNKYMYSFVNITPKHHLDLFDKLVTPILNYGCEVWGFSQARVIERVHLQFCKRLLCVKTSTQNDFVYGELGRTDFYTRRVYIIIKYWLKVIATDERKYIQTVYKLMLNDLESNNRIINWAQLIKTALTNLGFAYVWLAQGVGNNLLFLKLLKQRLNDTFIQNWESRLQTSSRAIFYKELSSFDYKQYLDIINIKKFRIAVTKLRLSSHRLEIETGRWARPLVERQNRKCKLCNLSVVEDEFHFVLECPAYVQLRNLLIKPYHRNRPNMLKMVQLTSSENKKEIRGLAEYAFKGFALRNELMYLN